MLKVKTYWKVLLLVLCGIALFFFKYTDQGKKESTYEQMMIGNKSYVYAHEGTALYFKSLEDEKIYKFDNNEGPFIDLSAGDIDGDGKEELLAITGKDGAEVYFSIFDPVIEGNQITLKKKYSMDMSSVKPWRVEVCEIDGDGIAEIFIGVYKSTRFYPNKENRPFFFNFVDGKLVKKWAGSKVRNNFYDICFADINGDGVDEFFVVESDGNGSYVVAAYHWFGFGFILWGETQKYEAIVDIHPVHTEKDEKLNIKIIENGMRKSLILNSKSFIGERGE